MDCLYLELTTPYEVGRVVGDKLSSARNEWVRVEKEKPLYARVLGDYGVIARPWFLKSLGLVEEVLKALDKPLEGLRALREAWSLLGEEDAKSELLVCSDGVVRTPYSGVFTWFHGQRIVNHLLKQHGVQLVEDYDGYTVIETRVERPYTPEKLDKALKLIAMGVELYALIKKVQVAEAVKTTLTYLARLAEKMRGNP